MRLRAGGLWACSIGLAIGFAGPRGENGPVSRFGVPTRGWTSEIKLSECQDNQTLIAALTRLWASQPHGPDAYDHPYFIGVQLNGLVPDRLHSLNLFDALDDEQSRARLLASHGRAQQQIRPQHPRPRHHAHRLQSRPHPNRLPQHPRSVLRTCIKNAVAGLS